MLSVRTIGYFSGLNFDSSPGVFMLCVGRHSLYFSRESVENANKNCECAWEGGDLL